MHVKIFSASNGVPCKKVIEGLPLFELNVFSIILLSSILFFHSLTIKLIKTFIFLRLLTSYSFIPYFFLPTSKFFWDLWSAILCSPAWLWWFIDKPNKSMEGGGGTYSGETSPTFGHANANFSVFIDRIRNRFLKK